MKECEIIHTRQNKVHMHNESSKRQPYFENANNGMINEKERKKDKASERKRDKEKKREHLRATLNKSE